MNMMNRGKYNGDNWALITPVEQKEVEEQGYSLLKEDKIKCGNCQKPLIEIIKVKEDKSINTAIRVKCPYCGDKSFWYKISGKIYVQAVNGLSIGNAPIDVRNNIMFTNVEVIKNGP